MSTDPGEHRETVTPDSAHLDEDAEALEDPVHSGDALHQREAHHHGGDQERNED